MKAKSRLKKIVSSRPQVVSKTKRKKTISHLSLVSSYFKHLPALLISLPFYFICFYIFKNIYPEKIRHFLVPNTYLPLQIPFFIANFFFFGFLFLKTRRGFLMSILIFLNLFLKLQGMLTSLIFFIIFIPILLLELIATAIDRK